MANRWAAVGRGLPMEGGAPVDPFDSQHRPRAGAVAAQEEKAERRENHRYQQRPRAPQTVREEEEHLAVASVPLAAPHLRLGLSPAICGERWSELIALLERAVASILNSTRDGRSHHEKFVTKRNSPEVRSGTGTTFRSGTVIALFTAASLVPYSRGTTNIPPLRTGGALGLPARLARGNRPRRRCVLGTWNWKRTRTLADYFDC
jgi:hypothetical protein